MSRDTRSLIEQLTADVAPVRPLAAPWRRAAGWLGIVCSTALLLVLALGWRGEPPGELAHPGGAWSWWGSLLTGVLATYAVFQVSVPGRAPAWAWLPLPAALAWFAGMGWGCMALAGSPATASGMGGWHCGLAITLVSAPLLLVMLVLVRHAGVVRPAPTALLAMLSAAGLSSAAVSLVHGHESAWMTLAWHGGVALLLSVGAALAGRPLLAWIGYRRV
jgi:hypothetical protein